MHKTFLSLLVMVMLLPLVGATMPEQSIVQPVQADVQPAESGVYTEDFSTYAAKDYVDDTEWDIWA